MTYGLLGVALVATTNLALGIWLGYILGIGAKR